MKHDKPLTPDDPGALPPQAVDSLEYAFRREFSRTPSRREHVRIQRERTRRFVETQRRHWSVEER